MTDTFKDIEKLEADLWEAADNLRANSKLTSSNYFMPVLGVIFLRHAANRFEAATRQIEADQGLVIPVAGLLRESESLLQRALRLFRLPQRELRRCPVLKRPHLDLRQLDFPGEPCSPAGVRQSGPVVPDGGAPPGAKHQQLGQLFPRADRLVVGDRRLDRPERPRVVT